MPERDSYRWMLENGAGISRNRNYFQLFGRRGRLWRLARRDRGIAAEIRDGDAEIVSVKDDQLFLWVEISSATSRSKKTYRFTTQQYEEWCGWRKLEGRN